MFEDFDSLDMYGFLDYLEESSNIMEVDREELDRIISIEESYGIYEEDGQLFIENEMLDSVMDQYNLSEEEAIDMILSACEEEINSLSEYGRVKSKRKAAWEARSNNGNVPQGQQTAQANAQALNAQNKELAGLQNLADKEIAGYQQINKNFQQVIDNKNQSSKNYDNLTTTVKTKTKKAQGHLDTANSEYDDENKRTSTIENNHRNNIVSQNTQHRKDQTKNIVTRGAAGAAIGAGAVGAGLLAHRAYKKHKENKRKNRGIRGMVRRGIKRLREDYGIYEENGQLFIENEVLDYVMNEFDLYEEDAIDLIMETYEDEKKAAEEKYKKQVDYVKANNSVPTGPGIDRPYSKKDFEEEREEIYRDYNRRKDEEIYKNHYDLGDDNHTANSHLKSSKQIYGDNKSKQDNLTKQIATVRGKTKKLRKANDELETKNTQELATRQAAHEEKQKGVKRNSLIGGAAVGAGAVGAGLLAHRAYKKHKENKRKNRGIRGMVRRGIKRLREDYGIYEENGQLFIENEMLNFVMDEYDLYEEDAIDLIMESYEIEEEELYSEAEEIELYSEGIADYDPRKMKQNAKNFLGASVTHKLSQAYGMDSDETRNAVKTTGKALAKSAALPAAGTIAAGGATALAYRALKKRKGKKFNSKKRRRR